MQTSFKTLIVLFILLNALNTFSAIELLEPKNIVLDQDSDPSIGKLEAGQILNLIFYKKFQGFDWQEIQINESVFPKSWTYEITDKEQNFEIKIFVPLNEQEKIQRIEVKTFSGSFKE